MPITPEVSAKMLELQGKSGKSYKQIGEEVGTSNTNVGRYLNGEVKNPDIELLHGIIESIGGVPEDVLSKKTITPPAPVPILDTKQAFELYDRMLSEADERWRRQEQRHKEHLARCDDKHREDVTNLKAAQEETIKSKDAWIDRIKGERDNLKQELDEARAAQRSLRTVITILAIMIAVLICIFVIPDALDGTWGFFRY